MSGICVFCGSRAGLRSAYADLARALGCEVARRGHELVFGGGGTGLMGAVADGALEAGGQVTGVLPDRFASREFAHSDVSDLRQVGGMHERKALMYELASVFVALPGGLGTLDEVIEVLTWGQLRIHDKPCGLLNPDGYYDPLLAMLERAVAEGFLSAHTRQSLVVAASPVPLLDALLGPCSR